MHNTHIHYTRRQIVNIIPYPKTMSLCKWFNVPILAYACIDISIDLRMYVLLLGNRGEVYQFDNTKDSSKCFIFKKGRVIKQTTTL